jgi:hypothetical protein
MSKVCKYNLVNIEDINTSSTSSTSNKTVVSKIIYNNSDLIVQGPKLTLKDNVEYSDDKYYVKLLLNTDEFSCMKFLTFIRNTEKSLLAEIHEKCELWYGVKNIKMMQIEHEHCNSYVVEDDITMSLCADKGVEFYDINNNIVKPESFKNGSTVVPIISLKNVIRDCENHRIWFNWKLEQIKGYFKIPVCMLDNHDCDDTESDCDDIYVEDYEFTCN